MATNTYVDNIRRGLKAVGKLSVLFIFAALIGAIMVIDGVVALFAGDFQITLGLGVVLVGASLFYLNDVGQAA